MVRVADLEVLVRVNSKAVSNLENKLKRTRSGLDRAGKSSEALRKTISRLGLAVAGFVTIRAGVEALKIADNFKLLDARVKGASDSFTDFQNNQRKLQDIARNTGSSYEAIVSVFQRLKISQDDLGESNSNIIEFTDLVSKLGATSGATQTALSDALRQLGQGLSGGVLRAEEFNSVLENTPEIANAIASGLGVGTGELRRMVLAGKVLSTDVFNAVLSQSDKINEEFAEFPETLGRSVNDIKISLGNFLNTIVEVSGVGKAIQGLLGSLSKGLQNATTALNPTTIKDYTNAISKLIKEREKLVPLTDESLGGPQAENARQRLEEADDRLVILQARLGQLAKTQGEELKIAETQSKRKKDLLKKQKEEEQKIINNANKKALDAEAKKNNELALATIKARKLVADQVIKNETQLMEEIIKIKEIALLAEQEAYAEKQALLLQRQQEELEALQEQESEKNKILVAGALLNFDFEKDLNAKRIARLEVDEGRKREIIKIGTDAAKAGLDVLAEQSKEAFEVNKALALATALIKGYEAIVSAYAAGSAVFGPIGGASFAGLAAVAVNAQIQKIRNQDFQARQFGGAVEGAVRVGEGGEEIFRNRSGEQFLIPSQSGFVEPVRRESKEKVININIKGEKGVRIERQGYDFEVTLEDSFVSSITEGDNAITNALDLRYERV